MSATRAPVIETERLVLRGPEPRDIPSFVDYYRSERSRFTGGPVSAGDAWRRFASGIGHWHIRGFGMWVVTFRDDNAVRGLVGCWHPEGWPERELAWIVMPEAEGRGIAFEAASAARSHAYLTLGWRTAVSYIDRDNARSIALARRLGAVEDAGAHVPDSDASIIAFRHPGPEAVQ